MKARHKHNKEKADEFEVARQTRWIINHNEGMKWKNKLKTRHKKARKEKWKKKGKQNRESENLDGPSRIEEINKSQQ